MTNTSLPTRIYLNPQKYYGNPLEGWELAEEYLSGHVRDKLLYARQKAAEEPDELAQAVEKVLSDQTIVPQVVKFIRQYKTKQGINNALNKEFKDSKRTSEIYSSIKPLIADKKGK